MLASQAAAMGYGRDYNRIASRMNHETVEWKLRRQRRGVKGVDTEYYEKNLLVRGDKGKRMACVNNH